MLLWGVVQCGLAVSHQCFGTTCRSHLQWSRRIRLVVSYECFGTDRLSRNVGVELSNCAALHPRRAKISFKPWWKPENMTVETYAQDLIKIL